MDASILAEEWRPVAGYEGLYEVSNFARVRRSPHSMRTGSQAVPGKVRNAKPAASGRLQLSLCKAGRYKCVRVHSLVAEAFIGPRPPGKQVNHIDGNHRNNVPSNLEYVTQKEHDEHTTRMGLRPSGSRHGSVTCPGTLAGEKNPNSKLTAEDVVSIRRLVAQGASYAQVAKAYGLDRTAVGLIVRRVNWRHVA